MDGAALLNPTSGGTLFMGRQFDANYTGTESAAVARPSTPARSGRESEIGPGHAALMRAADGIERVSYHFYDANTTNGEPTLGIKTVLFGADGWPRPGWDLAEGVAIGTRLNADAGATASYWLDGGGSAPALASYTRRDISAVGRAPCRPQPLHADLARVGAGAGNRRRRRGHAGDGQHRPTTRSAWFIERTSDASFRILNVGSGLALQLPAAPAVRGAVPQTGAYGVNLSNQRWFLTPAGGNTAFDR